MRISYAVQKNRGARRFLISAKIDSKTIYTSEKTRINKKIAFKNACFIHNKN